MGIFGLVGVVIQSNEVEPRLDLITATTKHMVFADTLASHLVTPEKKGSRIIRKEPKRSLKQQKTDDMFLVHLQCD